MSKEDILQQAENDRANRLERLDKAVIDARKKLDNHNLDIKTAEDKKTMLLEEVADLENTVKAAVQVAYKKRQGELDLATSELEALRKADETKRAELHQMQEAHAKDIEALEQRKKTVEQGVADNQVIAEKHKRTKQRFEALAQTIKDNLNAADE